MGSLCIDKVRRKMIMTFLEFSLTHKCPLKLAEMRETDLHSFTNVKKKKKKEDGNDFILMFLRFFLLDVILNRV